MPRIKTAHWHGGQPPGTEFDVDETELRALVRDGRVAEVLPEPAARPDPAPAPAPKAEPAGEATPADAEAEAAAPERASRKRR
ncbi:hypothetical protein [Streptomyces sp. bgisy034]|uniref:hypothetical protein n=1 Tax=Streptomyces sp. bgisy034 TaxID=3413774 RepID=UPI003EBBBA20